MWQHPARPGPSPRASTRLSWSVPALNASVAIPTLEWEAVSGATYYKVELSTSPTFVPVHVTYNTYNLRITPVAALALNTYYWRVSGVDADGHVGANTSRRFTLIALPAATYTIPELLTPNDGEQIATDPTFTWTRVIGAHYYRLVVSTDPGFSAIYGVNTDYNSYTPYSGEPRTSLNGTYYWKVEARTSYGSVIATSAARSLTSRNCCRS